MGDLVPRGCISGALPIVEGFGNPLFLDARHMQAELLELLEGGGLPTVELPVEEDKE